MASTIREVFEKKPEWVSREISNPEAQCIALELKNIKAVRGLEIGSASGFSAACIYGQLKANSPKNAKLSCFDLNEKCYYDNNHNTGDAAWEIHGKTANISITTGVTSADIPNPPAGEELYDFLFIDANHRNPWAAFDLLSLGRYLKDGALVALDDVNMMYNPKFRDCNGGRDIYRCWQGEKWRYKTHSNIGFVKLGDHKDMLVNSVVASLWTDWDLTIEDAVLDRFIKLAGFYGPNAQSRVAQAIEARKVHNRTTKKLPDALLKEATVTK
jgi:predicted O-methyltransferase YrrM